MIAEVLLDLIGLEFGVILTQRQQSMTAKEIGAVVMLETTLHHIGSLPTAALTYPPNAV